MKESFFVGDVALEYYAIINEACTVFLLMHMLCFVCTYVICIALYIV